MGDPNNVLLVDQRLVLMLPQKCASTSIQRALLDALGRTDAAVRPGVFMTCSTRQAAALRAGGYLVAGVSRNPAERLLSCWADKVRHRLHREFRRLGFTRGMEFEPFARRVCEIPDPVADPHFRSQAWQLCLEGALVPQLMMRVEGLAVDWEWFTAAVADRFPHPIPPLGRLRVSEKPGIGDTSAELPGLIARRYAEDYRALNYRSNGR